jgi:hypothetical protein
MFPSFLSAAKTSKTSDNLPVFGVFVLRRTRALVRLAVELVETFSSSWGLDLFGLTMESVMKVALTLTAQNGLTLSADAKPKLF